MHWMLTTLLFTVAAGCMGLALHSFSTMRLSQGATQRVSLAGATASLILLGLTLFVVGGWAMTLSLRAFL